MLEKLFEHCILTKYSDVILADCYKSFDDAMKTLVNNPATSFENHIKYTHIFKFYPVRIRTFLFNREFDVPYKIQKQ